MCRVTIRRPRPSTRWSKLLSSDNCRYATSEPSYHAENSFRGLVKLTPMRGLTALVMSSGRKSPSPRTSTLSSQTLGPASVTVQPLDAPPHRSSCRERGLGAGVRGAQPAHELHDGEQESAWLVGTTTVSPALSKWRRRRHDRVLVVERGWSACQVALRRILMFRSAKSFSPPASTPCRTVTGPCAGQPRVLGAAST